MITKALLRQIFIKAMRKGNNRSYIELHEEGQKIQMQDQQYDKDSRKYFPSRQ